MPRFYAVTATLESIFGDGTSTTCYRWQSRPLTWGEYLTRTITAVAHWLALTTCAVAIFAALWGFCGR